MSLPKISIITIVYNRVQDIEYTLESVVYQQYSNIEYIVIDGNSSDGTQHILAKYATKIDILISEPDKGIYDAMNKGLTHATGDYVLFMNGGDQFYNHTVLYDIFLQVGDIEEVPDIIYGECQVIDRQRQPMALRSSFYRRALPAKATPDAYKYGTSISHQSFMAKRAIVPLYDLRYTYSSDIDWMLKCMEKSSESSKVNVIISSFVYGDSSVEHIEKSQWERFLIFGRHYGWFRACFYHLVIAAKAIINKWISL
jgi:hypothetical protein